MKSALSPTGISAFSPISVKPSSDTGIVDTADNISFLSDKPSVSFRILETLASFRISELLFSVADKFSRTSGNCSSKPDAKYEFNFLFIGPLQYSLIAPFVLDVHNVNNTVVPTTF